MRRYVLIGFFVLFTTVDHKKVQKLSLKLFSVVRCIVVKVELLGYRREKIILIITQIDFLDNGCQNDLDDKAMIHEINNVNRGNCESLWMSYWSVRHKKTTKLAVAARQMFSMHKQTVFKIHLEIG